MDLCSGSGAWSRPYKEAGYEVKEIDIEYGKLYDVRLIHKTDETIYGILAAPPCTHLAGSGARWWKKKGEGALLEALSIVDACLRAVIIYDPVFWCLENPVGRLSRFLGKARFYFHPYEYAGYSDDPEGEAYTKKTCLWGNFNIPEKKPIKPTSQKIWKMGPSPERSKLRSITPSGFAKAFYMVNNDERFRSGLQKWF